MINFSERNLDHIYLKHGIEKVAILNILNSPDIITKVGINVKYYYKDSIVVIVARENKHREWTVKTEFQNLKPFLMGNIIYENLGVAK